MTSFVHNTAATGTMAIAGDTVTVDDKSDIGTVSTGSGNAAPITVTANQLVMQTEGAIGSLNGGSGRGGSVTINVDQLRMSDTGTQIGTSTIGSGVGGNLVVNARTVELLRGANLGSNTQGGSTGAGGATIVTARESVLLDGGEPGDYDPDIQNLTAILRDVDTGFSTFTRGSGQAGRLEVNTPRLAVRNSAGMTASTLASGNAGTLEINADVVQLQGKGGLGSVSSADGNAGAIEINAQTVALSGGTIISGDALGSGDGGNLTVNANTVTMQGGSRIGAAASSSGQGGTIAITTRTLDITGQTSNGNTPSAIAATTFGSGNAGQITLRGDRITVANRAAVNSSTLGSGNAGQILIQSTDTLDIDNAVVAAAVGTGATGNGGNVLLTAPNLTLANGAAVTSSSLGQGVAGNITTRGDRLRLSDRASIQAETRQGDGGNISLTASQWVILRHNSNISTTAGTAASGGNGGNIAIATEFLLGVPSENSDITANAFTGNGGRIDIEATQIYGFSTLGYLTPLSDITASSEFGAAGIIALDTNFDAAQGVNELPTDLSDRTDQIFDSCSAVGSNRFTVTGRGGVGEFLQPTLNHSEDWQDTRTIVVGTATQPFTLDDPSATMPLPPTLLSLMGGTGCKNPAASP
jgi:large exoprotein involved in heme utilization and adhesion